MASPSKQAGYGVFVRYPNKSKETLSESCRSNCSNYEAELMAITAGVELLHQEFEVIKRKPSDIVIFSHLSSALGALKTPPYQHPEVEKAALAIYNILTSYDIKVTLRWIPAGSRTHDLFGNEKADKLAKHGTKKPQKDNQCTIATVKTILKSQSKETWQNKGANGSTGRANFTEKKAIPRKKKGINQHYKPDQRVIFQFRTSHAAVNMHLNHINPLHAPMCRHCRHAYETTVHLLECPGLQILRRKFLSVNPTLCNTLYAMGHLTLLVPTTFCQTETVILSSLQSEVKQHIAWCIL